MFLIACVLVAALAVPLFGGRLSALADVRAGWSWVLALALGMQLVGIYAPGGLLADGARAFLQVASFAVAAVFLVANRRLPGMLLVAAGALCNLAAMGANGGVMPASPAALRTAGLPTRPGGFTNSAAVPHPRLAFLGDVFAIPHAWPLHNIFSIGDVLIVLGLAWALHRICGSRLVPRLRSGQRSTPDRDPGVR